jgi:hypothetical protein
MSAASSSAFGSTAPHPMPPLTALTADGMAIPLPADHELLGKGYESAQALKEALNDWGATTGLCFTLSQPGSRNAVTGDYTYYAVTCDRGRARPSRSKGIRTTVTVKTGCLWKGSAVANRVTNYRWHLRLKENSPLRPQRPPRP